MFYKYIYYRIFDYTIHWFDPFAPQFTSTLFLSFLPASNAYFVLYFLDYFNLYPLHDKFISSETVIILIILFVVVLIFNQLYFFAIYNWKELIRYFKENEIPEKTKRIANGYIVISIGSLIFLYLFDSFR